MARQPPTSGSSNTTSCRWVNCFKSCTFCLSVWRRRSSVVPAWRLRRRSGPSVKWEGFVQNFPPGCFVVGQMFRVQGGGEKLRDDQTIKAIRPSVLAEPEEAPVIDDVRQTGLLSTYFDILGDNVNKGSQLGPAFEQNTERRVHPATC